MNPFCILHRCVRIYFRVLNPCVNPGQGIYMSPAFIQINMVVKVLHLGKETDAYMQFNTTLLYSECIYRPK